MSQSPCYWAHGLCGWAVGKDLGSHELEPSVGGNKHYPGLRGLQDHTSLLLCLLDGLIPALEVIMELFPAPQVIFTQVDLSLQLTHLAVQLCDVLITTQELCLQLRHLLGGTRKNRASAV